MNADLFTWINNLTTTWPSAATHTLMFLSENFQYAYVVMLLVLWFLGKGETKTENRRTVVYTFLGTVVAIVITTLISKVYAHPRPFMVMQVHQLIDHEPANSFPSNHATFAFGVACMMFARKRAWGAILVVLGFIFGFGRVMGGVHWPMDIVGGFVVALLATWGLLRTTRLWEPFVQVTLKTYNKITMQG